MEQVTIRFQYTEEEYVKAMRKYLLVTDTVKKFDLILAAVGVPSMLVYLFLSSFSVFSIIFKFNINYRSNNLNYFTFIFIVYFSVSVSADRLCYSQSAKS